MGTPVLRSLSSLWRKSIQREKILLLREPAERKMQILTLKNNLRGLNLRTGRKQSSFRERDPRKENEVKSRRGVLRQTLPEKRQTRFQKNPKLAQRCALLMLEALSVRVSFLIFFLTMRIIHIMLYL